ncbi:MAG TPA: hypothetical protein VHB98_17590 [Chloroflexota bacterium]|nr:hypothetical protein [Chloroflexota bacterium]
MTNASRRAAGKPLFWMLLLLAAYFIPRGEYSNPDSHLALSYALVEQHTVRIDRYLEMSGTRDTLIDKAVYCGPQTSTATCHRYFTDKAPGISLVVAAVYGAIRPLLPRSLMPTRPGSDRFILRLLLTLLAMTLPCAAFVVSYRRFLADLAGEVPALIVAVGYGFGSMALPFSTLLFSHALSAALLFWAFMLIFQALPRPRERCHGAPAGWEDDAWLADSQGMGIPARAMRAAQRSSLRVPVAWQPLAAGLLAGYAIGCEYPTAIIAGLLGLYALSGDGTVVERAAVAARYGIGLLIGVAPLLIYNLVAFGNPLALGYVHLTDPQYAAGMAHGILGVGLPTWSAVWGTTFSPYRGIFILSPWLLLAAPGLLAMGRAGWRREAWLCGAISVSYFLFQSGYAFWDGGASVGPRHFLPALPFLALPVAFAVRRAAWRRLAIGLVSFSVVTLLLVLVTNPTYVPPAPVPFVDQTLHDLASGRLQNNWGMLFRLPGFASLVPLAIALFLLGRGMMRQWPRHA